MLALTRKPTATALGLAGLIAITIWAMTALPLEAQGTGRPASPTNLTVWKGIYDGQEQIRAYWSPGTGEASRNTTHYKITYGTTSSPNTHTIETQGAGNGLTFGDRPGDHIPTLEIQYRYRVRAVNSNAEPAQRESSSAATTTVTLKNKAKPSAPTGLTGTAESTSSVNLSWNHQESSGVDRYQVCLHASSSQPAYRKCDHRQDLRNAGNSHTFTRLDDDTTYYFWVRARNDDASNGEKIGPWSSRYSVRTIRIQDDTPPAVSGIAVLSKTHDTIEFRWNPLTQDWIDEFRWTVSTENQDPTGSGTSTTGTEATKADLDPDTAYYLNVRAVNKYTDNNGNDRTKAGPWRRASTRTNVTPPTHPPGDVTNLQATAESYTTIRLEWDQAHNATGYEIEATHDGPTTTRTVPAGTTSWRDDSLEDGDTGAYRVRALNSNATEADDQTGKWSSRASATTPERPPPITAVGAYPGGWDRILFRWERASHATTGYEAQYSRNMDFSNPVSRTLGRDTREHTFTGLEAETTYYFRVRSRAPGSDFSEAKSAETSQRPKPRPTYRGELRILPGTVSGIARYDQLAIYCRDPRASGEKPVGWVIKYNKPVYNYDSVLAVPEGETRRRVGTKPVEVLTDNCGNPGDPGFPSTPAFGLYHLMQGERVSFTLQACSEQPCRHYSDSNGDYVTDDTDFNLELAGNLGPTASSSGQARSKPARISTPRISATHNQLTVTWNDEPQSAVFRVFYRKKDNARTYYVNLREQVGGQNVSSVTLPMTRSACRASTACIRSSGGNSNNALIQPETTYEVWVRGYIRGHSTTLYGGKSPIVTVTTPAPPSSG